MRIWLPIALLLLWLTVTGCARRGDAGPLPTVAPPPDLGALTSAAEEEADSPRVTPEPADSGVPPTWTPAPRATAPPILATRTPDSNAPPGLSASEGEVYVVAAGDTLAAVAEAFGVEPAELAAANGLEEGAPLRAGQLLLIPR